MKNRSLKVRSGYYDRPSNPTHSQHVAEPVPFVLIKGYWLEQANFDIGRKVSVEVREGQLILTTGED